LTGAFFYVILCVPIEYRMNDLKIYGNPTPTNLKIDYKYSEDEILSEMKEYIDKTYVSHYSLNKFQATEFIIDSGHGEGFCIGNILKYSQRYGKKAGKNRNDLLKVIHYGIMALHNHDTTENKL